MERTTKELTTLHLSVDDVRELLPGEDFKYKMYWDYNDKIDEGILKDCMPEEKEFKREDGSINYEGFVNDWKNNIQDQIRERNDIYINESLYEELRTNVKKALEGKDIEYDEFEFDFYIDELYDIDLCLDDVLERSPIVYNIVWNNSYDGFDEDEKLEDGQAIKDFLELNPGFTTKEKLEGACAEGIYSGSDLKINIKTNIADFFDTIRKGGKDIGGYDAVLHLSINGSGSPEFKIDGGYVEFGKKLKTDFDYWDWNWDGHYGVREVYGGVINNDF